MEFPISIVVGFFRLCLLILFLYYMNRKLVNTSRSNNFLDFVIRLWFKYGSIAGLVIFGSIQLNIYNLLNVLIILVIVVVIDFIGFNNFFHLRRYIETESKAQVKQILRDIERKRPFSSWVGLSRRSKNKQNIFLFAVVAVLSVITFGSRFYFFKYDLYSLSGTWLTDLKRVTGFDSQIWFGDEVGANAGLAYANFYGKLTDISAEIALQSMAMLESTLLSIVIFWTVRKITPSKYYAPVAAAMTFALAYTLRPINVYFLLETKPILLALTFGLPAMVYLLRPAQLRMTRRGYFLCMMSAFTVMGLIDLFAITVLIPPFIVLAVLFTRSKTLSYFWVGMLAYVAAVALLIGIYALVAVIHHNDFMMFLHSGLLSIGSYTYVPQLLLPYEDLVRYYQLSTYVSLAFLLFYRFVKKERWGFAISMMIYFNILVLLANLNNAWIDSDLMNLALSAFIPIVAGVHVAILVRLIKPVADRATILHKPMVAVTIAGIFAAAFYYQRPTINQLTLADTTPKQVLEAYDKIASGFFPYSYAVVNDNLLQPISENKHFFITYDNFINKYPVQDSIYFKHANDEKFFRNNPDKVIPKSVLLFVYSKDKVEMYRDNGDVSDKLTASLNQLKERGRRIDVFYQNKNVTVFEIINEPGQSKISDLIY